MRRGALTDTDPSLRPSPFPPPPAAWPSACVSRPAWCRSEEGVWAGPLDSCISVVRAGFSCRVLGTCMALAGRRKAVRLGPHAHGKFYLMI